MQTLTAHILVVDDDQAVLDMLEPMLDAMGYSSHLTPDPQQGLDRFAGSVFDVVFSEVSMPGIDGIEMVRRMRSTDPTVVPIIMTARNDQETAIRALECGVHSFLRKPFTADQLRKKLDAALTERRHLVATRLLIGDLMQTRSDLEQRLVEQDQRLSHTERYLNHLLDAAPFAILSADLDGRVLTCNHTAQRMYGYGHVELLRRDLCGIFGTLPTSAHEKSSHLHKDGTRFSVLVHQREILDELDRPIAYLYVVEDQTARDQLENQLLYAQRLSLLGDMAPRIAHELKVPLQIICGYSELAIEWLQKGTLEQAEDSMRHIIPATHQIQDMVHQIEHLGKPTEFHEEDLDIEALIRETLADLEPLGAIKYCNVICNFSEDLPSIRGDATQMHQLLRNLIINACHAMEDAAQRDLTLELECSDDDRSLSIRVSDTGMGISEENLAQIFNPFFSTKSSGKGTGLGLPIVKTIVERYNGHINVQSELGLGTCFQITFPCAPSPHQQMQERDGDVQSAA